MHAATGGVIAGAEGDRVVVRAIDRITFSWKEGDRVGIVGHNGAGKTTLLRAIAGIYEPTAGSIDVQGRVASMLSIALGMEPEVTGYEYISMRGTILGLTKREIAVLVDGVREFSELGEYINMPLRTYSSGMSMRLAFAISTSVTADIIVMDEWLAVGDEQFSRKAQERLHSMVDQAKILVMSSHSPDLIAANCNRVVRLDHGHILSES
jgi:lipopolysaccharide transport system ATP-binding protein